MSTYPHPPSAPSLPFREGDGWEELGWEILFHVQHITNGGQCPINRVFIDDQWWRETYDVVMRFFGEDALCLQRFAEAARAFRFRL